METSTKRRIIIIAIIVLIIINISALITIFYNNKIRSKQLAKYNEIQEQVEVNGMNDFFRNQLKLDDVQFDRFQDINHEHMLTSRDIAKKMDDLRFDMLNEISKNDPDMLQLDHIAKKIGELHYELKLNTINHFIELKALCNDDQKEILQGMFMHMMFQNPDQPDPMRRNQRGRNRSGPQHRRNN